MRQLIETCGTGSGRSLPSGPVSSGGWAFCVPLSVSQEGVVSKLSQWEPGAARPVPKEVIKMHFLEEGSVVADKLLEEPGGTVAKRCETAGQLVGMMVAGSYYCNCTGLPHRLRAIDADNELAEKLQKKHEEEKQLRKSLQNYEIPRRKLLVCYCFL